MHSIEPYFNWRHLYIASEDELSPFFDRTYSEFEFVDSVYNYLIHPQWDNFGSRTLFVKILFVDYDDGYAILEFIGEWNDAIENDVERLKREVIDEFIFHGITKFILITENVLNFHSSDDCYYEEWFEDVREKSGWIVSLNMPVQTQYDFKKARLNNYVEMLNLPNWRTMKPDVLFNQVDNFLLRRLDA